ncbi:hypothetical protein GCM10010170_098320 [Dactylosporangium salmoneum]|uniref:Uncharacterized protein n=1 Tax=Dactylosporangium salmoneum TaxID=53361 RepID=A0ABP5UTD3_9ACTN
MILHSLEELLASGPVAPAVTATIITSRGDRNPTNADPGGEGGRRLGRCTAPAGLDLAGSERYRARTGPSSTRRYLPQAEERSLSARDKEPSAGTKRHTTYGSARLTQGGQSFRGGR